MPGLVISDLHLFARRSDGEACFASLRGRLQEADTLVLNGDVFDFRWSRFPTAADTARAARRWLEGVLAAFPGCAVHYVLGNHDCLATFEPHLADLASRSPRFTWHPEWCRLGRAMFVHGDCAQRLLDADGFRAYRAAWQSDHRRGPELAATAYQWADRLGITRLVHAWEFPRRETIRRVSHYLDHACPDWRSATTDCYFGHTHLPFAHEEFRGIRFHNTGSAIRGAPFHPCRFDSGV